MHKLLYPSKYWGNTNETGHQHYIFYLNMFKRSGLFEISYYTPMPNEKLKVVIDNKKVFIDHHDFISHYKTNYDFSFKAQYHKNFSYPEKMNPIPQMSFLDWNLYYSNRDKINYNAKSSLILNNQTSYGKARERRTRVKNILNSLYPGSVDSSITSQLDFFKKINNCLVYVHVPGYCNNILDRAHMQTFAFGCCVITTEIPNVLPYNKIFIPGVHYIKCKDDYSDLYDLIEWCKKNRGECVKIGQNAKQLFADYFTPEKISKYILEKINEKC